MIRILPSAKYDLARGFRFYEDQNQGLGSYFLETLISEIDSLESYAGIHPIVFGYFRFLSKHFPFAIYYSRDAEEIVIKAVLDCRQDPNWMRTRLKD